ncbi:MAG: hypothetical protein ACRD3J_12280, partial [Thermoanaerobaculia bacterium]
MATVYRNGAAMRFGQLMPTPTTLIAAAYAEVVEIGIDADFEFSNTHFEYLGKETFHHRDTE